MTPAPKRRWLRFSLRTLFVVVTIWAMWLGMRVYRSRSYTDAEIDAAIAGHTVGSPDGFDAGGVVYLVVPIGATMPRGEVFDVLGLEEGRIRDFYCYAANNDVTMRWRVSPSYEIECITAANDLGNNDIDYADSSRNVYGVRFRNPIQEELQWRRSRN